MNPLVVWVERSHSLVVAELDPGRGRHRQDQADHFQQRHHHRELHHPVVHPEGVDEARGDLGEDHHEGDDGGDHRAEQAHPGERPLIAAGPVQLVGGEVVGRIVVDPPPRTGQPGGAHRPVDVHVEEGVEHLDVRLPRQPATGLLRPQPDDLVHLVVGSEGVRVPATHPHGEVPHLLGSAVPVDVTHDRHPFAGGAAVAGLLLDLTLRTGPPTLVGVVGLALGQRPVVVPGPMDEHELDALSRPSPHHPAAGPHDTVGAALRAQRSTPGGTGNHPSPTEPTSAVIGPYPVPEPAPRWCHGR